MMPFKEVGETHLSQAIQQSRPFAIKPVITIKIGTHRTRTKRVAGMGKKKVAAALAFGDLGMVDHPGSLVFLLFEVLHGSHLLIQRSVRRQYVRRLQLQRERIFPIQMAIPLSAAFFLLFFVLARHNKYES
jgi:hypothetical protein